MDPRSPHAGIVRKLWFGLPKPQFFNMINCEQWLVYTYPSEFLEPATFEFNYVNDSSPYWQKIDSSDIDLVCEDSLRTKDGVIYSIMPKDVSKDWLRLESEGALYQEFNCDLVKFLEHLKHKMWLLNAFSPPA